MFSDFYFFQNEQKNTKSSLFSGGVLQSFATTFPPKMNKKARNPHFFQEGSCMFWDKNSSENEQKNTKSSLFSGGVCTR